MRFAFNETDNIETVGVQLIIITLKQFQKYNIKLYI